MGEWTQNGPGDAVSLAEAQRTLGIKAKGKKGMIYRAPTPTHLERGRR